jgi:hypothetical protein
LRVWIRRSPLVRQVGNWRVKTSLGSVKLSGGGGSRNRAVASGQQSLRPWRIEYRDLAKAPSISLDSKVWGFRPASWSKRAMASH